MVSEATKVKTSSTSKPNKCAIMRDEKFTSRRYLAFTLGCLWDVTSWPSLIKAKTGNMRRKGRSLIVSPFLSVSSFGRAHGL